MCGVSGVLSKCEWDMKSWVSIYCWHECIHVTQPNDSNPWGCHASPAQAQGVGKAILWTVYRRWPWSPPSKISWTCLLVLLLTLNLPPQFKCGHMCSFQDAAAGGAVCQSKHNVPDSHVSETCLCVCPFLHHPSQVSKTKLCKLWSGHIILTRGKWHFVGILSVFAYDQKFIFYTPHFYVSICRSPTEKCLLHILSFSVLLLFLLLSNLNSLCILYIKTLCFCCPVCSIIFVSYKYATRSVYVCVSVCVFIFRPHTC